MAATLEIVGTTPKGHGLAVVTREANAYGVSVECAQRAIEGAAIAPPMYMLGAIAVLGVTLAPLAAAAAVRIGLE